MRPKNNVVIAVVVLLVIIGLLTFVVAGRRGTKPAKTTNDTGQTEVIPTVDSSVMVDLTSKNNKRAVDLSVKGVPNGTTSVEYSLSYNTEKQGLQGIIGTMDTSNGETEKSISRELGTCSSGTCIYHIVVGKIKVDLKFNGSYGERIFSKEYDL